MKQISVTQVTYEALGKQNITYTDSNDLHYITGVVQMIVETAKVVDLRQTQITTSEYKENNLSHIESWYKQIESSYPEDYDPFL